MLAGGWADVGFSSSEIAVKETFEETGIVVTAKKLLKVLSKAKHDYPKSLEYVYKFFIVCEAASFEVAAGLETSEVKFVPQHETHTIYPLSLERNSVADIQDIFADHRKPWKATKFD